MTDLLLEPFVLRALAAGLGVALMSGVVGCFVIWRRMAYFGDSLSHSALLGVALGIATGIGINIGILIVCIGFSLALLWLQQRDFLTTDTLLGILAHAALSIGVVTLSLLSHAVDLHGYLFGDILTVTASDLWWIYAAAGMVLLLSWINWPSMVLITIHRDLAVAEGVNAFWMQVLFMLLMTLVVAVSFSIVGILLITSMLIIPAAAGRQLARSPEAMVGMAILLGMLSVVLGLWFALAFDTPFGPTIVMLSAALFVLVYVVTGLLRGK